MRLAEIPSYPINQEKLQKKTLMPFSVLVGLSFKPLKLPCPVCLRMNKDRPWGLAKVENPGEYRMHFFGVTTLIHDDIIYAIYDKDRYIKIDI